MKPPPFAYARAESLDEALDLLREAGPDAKLLAGGQSLLPLLAYRLIRPSHLVDLDATAGLDGIELADGAVELGALVRHARLERAALPGAASLLAQAAGLIGHVPIRVRGTLGGSLAHADPAAELPVACLALDARIVVRSSDGEHEVAAEDFFQGPFTTALGEAQLVAAVRLPGSGLRSGGAFHEASLRAGDFALAAAAVAFAVDGRGRIERARIALGGVAGRPVRSLDAEALVTGEELGAVGATEVGLAAMGACEVPDDDEGRHRRELVSVLVRDAVVSVSRELAA